jgi:hypothetical protein
MKLVKQGIPLSLLLAVVSLSMEVAGSDQNLKPKHLVPVRSIASPISYDNNSTTDGLYLEIKPYQWQRVTKIDQSRRWRLKMTASHPIQLYLLEPRAKVGNPPDRVKINSWAVRKWENVEEIAEDKFLPFNNEAAYGGTWSIYLYNQFQERAKVELFVDTSGKPTSEEKESTPFFLLILLFLQGGVGFLMYNLLKWRRSNPLNDNKMF